MDDLVKKLGLPDDLNKRLEALLKIETQKEQKAKDTKDPHFKEILEAKKEFRKAYNKLRRRPTTDKDYSKDFMDTDEEEAASSSEDISDSEEKDKDSMLDEIPDTLIPSEQRRTFQEGREKISAMEEHYLRKKSELEKVLQQLDEEDKIDGIALRKMADVLKNDNEGYDFDTENDELDKIINDLKNSTKDYSPDQDSVRPPDLNLN